MSDEKSEICQAVERLTEAFANLTPTLRAMADVLRDCLVHETYTEDQFYAERQQFPSPDCIEGGWYEYAYPPVPN